MSCDKLVFDLSQEIEGSPNVFIRKDWLNILDNQNQNYQSNQSIIDTSQLSNSNKYMSYREAYLEVPLLLSVAASKGTAAYTIGQYSIGLKNWFGTIIHSFTLDYNGTTIIQQTPFCNMWNSFKLMTTLSWADVSTQGATIGFYPDTAGAWVYRNTTASSNGPEISNNDCSYYDSPSVDTLFLNYYNQYNITSKRGGNVGLTKRIQWIAYGVGENFSASSSSYSTVGISETYSRSVWKSYVSQQTDGSATQEGLLQISCMATIYLKHIHSFFNMVPLIKGAFMKMTMNLNNASSVITMASNLISTIVNTVPVGGVNPIMIPSVDTGSNFIDDTNLPATSTIYYDLSVGATILNNTVSTFVTGSTKLSTGQLSKSIYLYVPAYTFNPVFEQAYLSNPVKQIKYTDIYQYQVTTGIPAGTQFNNLITNGIANIKSVLIIPFYKFKPSDGTTTYTEFQSPIDPAGTGPTAPMVSLGNFNVQISGQNAIYNMQRYTFEQFNNQLYGQNAVNGGLTDGLTSGLINFMDFQNEYCYYYVNVERMLPVEQSVPKSVQILGTNYSTENLNLWVFVEYGVEVSIDILTGARV